MNGKLRNMASVYLMRDNKVLLLYRQGGSVANELWIGSAGGHFDNEELNDATACVLREMNEELGLCPSDINGLTLRYITLRRTNGEIRQNYYFFAQLAEYIDDKLSSNEGVCKWFSLDDIAFLEMPFTAKYVMQHFCSIGIHTKEVYAGVANNDDVSFFSLPKF